MKECHGQSEMSVMGAGRDQAQKFGSSPNGAHSLMGEERQIAHYHSVIFVLVKNVKGAMGT